MSNAFSSTVLSRATWRIIATIVAVFLIAQCSPQVGAEPPEEDASEEPAQKRLEDLKTRHQTEHYAIAGTADRQELEELGWLLERMQREYATWFSQPVSPAPPPPSKPAGKTPPRNQKGPAARGSAKKGAAKPPEAETGKLPPDGDRFRVVILKDKTEYQDYCAKIIDLTTRASYPNGLFDPKTKTLFLVLSKDKNAIECALCRHGFLQFIDKHMPDPPPWLREGLAQYFETAQFFPLKVQYYKFESTTWKEMSKAVNARGTVPIHQLMHATKEEFDNPARGFGPGPKGQMSRRRFYRMESYTLIHFLLSDKSGKERMQDYIRDLAENGGKSSTITDKYFDMTICGRIKQPWSAHVQRMAKRK